MPIETITIDVYTAVYSASLKRDLKSGELDVVVPKIEAERWLGKYALLSSDRIEEEDNESRPAKTPRHTPSKDSSKDAGSGDGGVGVKRGRMGKRRTTGGS